MAESHTILGIEQYINRNSPKLERQLNDDSEEITVHAEDVAVSELQPVDLSRIPLYRRDIFPTSIVLSAEDMKEFSSLVTESNERAKRIEIENLDTENPEQNAQRINDLMPVEYEYVSKNGDSVHGLGIPRTEDHSFPDELKSFFISNAIYAQRAINKRPMNTVEVFFGFDKPSLKLDFQTVPSNPTENRSVINIEGRNEDWVISTADRINRFFTRKKAQRPLIHGSGTYDYFLYFVFIPAAIWLYFRYESGVFSTWTNQQSLFVNVILGLYIFLLSLLLARFLFQYIRWLFPPIEYYKKNRVGAHLHRLVAGAIGTTVILGATYDLIKTIFVSPL